MFVSRVKESDGDLFPTQFRFTYDGGLASLQFMVKSDCDALDNRYGVPHHLCKGFPQKHRDHKREHLRNW